MYPRLHPQSSASHKESSSSTASNRSNHRPVYQQPQGEDRKYHTPTDQLMVGFDKFIRRYESKFYFDNVQMFSFIFS